MRQSPLLFFGALLILLAFGLTTIWSTVPNLFPSQLLFIVIGSFFMLLAYKIDLCLVFSFSWVLYLISVGLLLSTFVLGEVTRGSTRWVYLGPFSLQFSEIIKPALAVFFAEYLSKHRVTSLRNLIYFLMLLALPVLLVLIQPDLGSSLVILALGLSLLIVSGLPPKYLILGLLTASFIAFPAYNHLRPYQQERLRSFINPYSDPAGSGYNIIQSVIAVGSGKISGLGVKQGTQSHLKFLPERHTDFIYASFAEEFGLVGSTLMFISYLILVTFWLKVAASQIDPPKLFLLTAIITVFMFQAIVNLGMNLGVLPVTGITLPLISYGGSSLISLFTFIGLGLNVNRNRV